MRIPLGILGAVVILLGLGSACSTPSETLVLDYADFGPPSLSTELLGQEWYQWDNEGGPDPSSHFEVKIVIYQGIPLAKVQHLYPVDRDRQKDYRYLARDAALHWLDGKIEAFRHEKASDPSLFEPLIQQLERTRRRIVDVLGDPDSGR
jgi:hypothetical protein